MSDTTPTTPDSLSGIAPLKPRGEARRKLTEKDLEAIDNHFRSARINLAANANPVTGLIVKAIELMGSLRLERLRDSWLSPDIQGVAPCAGFFVQAGGEALRTKHSAMWERVRSHPLYVRDVDSEIIPTYATITFNVPFEIALPAQDLAAAIPRMRQSAEDKHRMGIELRDTGGVTEEPFNLKPAEIQDLIGRFAFAVSALQVQLVPPKDPA